MFEIPNSQIAPLRSLFAGEPYTYLFLAVLAGNSPARVWVDDAHQPRCVLVWDKSACLYLLGAPSAEARQAVQHTLVQVVLPTAAAQNVPCFVIHTQDESWKPELIPFFPSMTLNAYPRVIYQLGQPTLVDWRERIPEGFSLHAIDAALLADFSLGRRDDLLQEIGSCWVSVERFLAQGFGYVMLHEGQIVCRCTAEYVSQGQCGIGIETEDSHRRRNLATLTAAAFVEHCAALGLHTHWEAWKYNRPSLATAEKIGFVRTLEYEVVFAAWPGLD